MKSIFTKLSSLLLCGVVALASCSDFSADLQGVHEKIDKLEASTKAEVERLEKEIEALVSSLEATYVKKAELQKVSNNLTQLSNMLDSKVTSEDVQKLIDAIEFPECDCPEPEACSCDLATIKKDIEDLKEDVKNFTGCNCPEDVPCTCDLASIKEDIKKIQANLDSYKTTTDKRLEEIEEKLNNLDSYATDTEVGELINGAKNELNGVINDAKAALAGDIKDAKAAVEEAFAKADAALSKRIDNLQTTIDNLDLLTEEDVNEAIAAAIKDYAGLNAIIDQLKNDLAALTGRVDALAAELRGIVMVPQIIKDGNPAIEFKSFVYVPMADDNDDYVSADGSEESVVVGDPTTVAYFHFNPSNFDIDAATYSVISTNVQLRSVSEPIATVGKVVKVGDLVKAELLRGKGTGNMFAFAATLANGAVITSDYALVLDARTNADALVIVDNNDAPLYTTLAAALENDAVMDLSSTDKFNFADYVKAVDPAYAAYGVEYKYSLVYTNDAEKVTVAEDGTAKFKWADGVQIVKVEAVLGNDVVRRAYIKVDVNFTEPELAGIYYTADVLASVQAERLAFEVKDIYVWAKALKDEPNTIEILKEVKDILVKIGEIAKSEESELQKNYLITEEAKKAYVLLNGVPGFVKKYTTFNGTGYSKVRVEYIPQITTIAELKAVIEMLEEQYAADIMGNFTESIVNFLPESLQNNFVFAWIIDALRGFQISDILENDTIVNLLEAVQSYIDFERINTYLNGILENYLGQNKYGEEAAKLAVEAQARAEAEQEIKAAFETANENLMANFQNGIWGKLYNFINVDLNVEENEIVAKILEHFQLTETVAAFEEMVESFIDYGESLVKYSYDSDAIEYNVTIDRYEVLED